MTLLIECAKCEEARLKLLEHPGRVREVIIREEGKLQAFLEGTTKSFRPSGDALRGRLPVMGFARKSMGLEELFMKITTGEVQ